MSTELSVLERSVGQLARLIDGFDPSQLRHQAYPTEWTVADVLSHVGSSAVIMTRGVEDRLAGREPDPDFNGTVWDAWNAKSPDDQAADARVADAILIDALVALTDEQRSALALPIGPMLLDFPAAVALRLAEHALHTWDVEVTFDPSAVLGDDVADVLIDRLGMIVGFIGRPQGGDQRVEIATTGTQRHLAVVLTADAVELVASDSGAPSDLTVPAEAFIRLVYGRLDPEHTPAEVSGTKLELLRTVFPGF